MEDSSVAKRPIFRKSYIDLDDDLEGFDGFDVGFGAATSKWGGTDFVFDTSLTLIMS